MSDLASKIAELRKETGVLPQEIHPSEWEELDTPKPWALEYFKVLPGKIVKAVKAKERDPLIPAQFGSRPSVLEKAFFNQANLDFLQNTILKDLLFNFKYKISRQTDISVHLLMVQVYDAQWKRFPESVYREKQPLLKAVGILDAFCLERAVHIILKEIQDFLVDRKHWENNPVPELPLPLYENNRNEFPLESQPFFVEKGQPMNVKPSNLSAVGTWPAN